MQWAWDSWVQARMGFGTNRWHRWNPRGLFPHAWLCISQAAWCWTSAPLLLRLTGGPAGPRHHPAPQDGGQPGRLCLCRLWGRCSGCCAGGGGCHGGWQRRSGGSRRTGASGCPGRSRAAPAAPQPPEGGGGCAGAARLGQQAKQSLCSSSGVPAVACPLPACLGEANGLFCACTDHHCC